MGRRKQKIHDPAEAARKAYESRRNPGAWGVNTDALALAQNADIHLTAATRQKVQRVTRYDCFALLESRTAIGPLHVLAVRRLMDLIELRFRLGSMNPTEKVDGASRPDQRTAVTVESLEALKDIADVLGRSGAQSAKLLLALCEPAVRDGQPVNNWRAVVEHITGEHYPHGQTALVRAACENLRLAWIEIDGGQRRAA